MPLPLEPKACTGSPGESHQSLQWIAARAATPATGERRRRKVKRSFGWRADGQVSPRIRPIGARPQKPPKSPEICSDHSLDTPRLKAAMQLIVSPHLDDA